LMGKNDYDFFPKEQADFFTSKDREALNENDVTDIQEEIIKTAYGEKWLHTKKIPLVNDHGEPTHLLGISEDITEKKHSEEQVKQLNKDLLSNISQLEIVNKELESFSYSVSHDLRAPLRAIDGYAKIIEEDYGKNLDEEGRRLLETVQYNAKKMGSLIDDLLAFSRLGKKEPTKTDLNMVELVEGALFEINKATEHKAKVNIGQLHPAKGDYGLINQVVINLLSNAIKYSAKSPRPLVEVSSEKSNGEIIYTIKDNGAGFDMRYVHKLFGVFQRLHTPDEFEGTGVGLAIVLRIITKHGGKVWAEGKKNEGATFKFSLPIN
ncbi:MAG TPA: ATP-binding protein, partial [Bacteroidia bacterium]|nr:ATP-binding protein [Bacteroidia bacterium]